MLPLLFMGDVVAAADDGGGGAVDVAATAGDVFADAGLFMVDDAVLIFTEFAILVGVDIFRGDSPHSVFPPIIPFSGACNKKYKKKRVALI